MNYAAREAVISKYSVYLPITVDKVFYPYDIVSRNLMLGFYDSPK